MITYEKFSWRFLIGAYIDIITKHKEKITNTPFIEFMLDIINKALRDYVKDTEKSDQKILALIRKSSTVTISEMCTKTGMSESGVKKSSKNSKSKIC